MDDNQTNLEGAEENEKKNAEQMDPEMAEIMDEIEEETPDEAANEVPEEQEKEQMETEMAEIMDEIEEETPDSSEDAASVAEDTPKKGKGGMIAAIVAAAVVVAAIVIALIFVPSANSGDMGAGNMSQLWPCECEGLGRLLHRPPAKPAVQKERRQRNPNFPEPGVLFNQAWRRPLLC